MGGIKMTFREKIVKVQRELKAPKNLKNTFGGYSYRSAEGILESVKPLLTAEGLFMTLSDEVVMVGDRIYVKATVTVTDGEFSTTTSAFAREAETKKGMDESQITGTASSYARKYALNGMFCIDDTKDADTDEYANERKARGKKESSGIVCTKCGKELKPEIKTKAGWLTAHEFAEKFDGLCPDCVVQKAVAMQAVPKDDAK